MAGSDRPFTHPDMGHQARLEQFGTEVRLTFVCSTRAKADSLFDSIGAQLEAGSLNLTLMGKPTSVTKS